MSSSIISSKDSFFSFISFVLFSCSKENNTNVILLNLEPNNYRELVLEIQSHLNPNPLYIKGVRNDNYWAFCYPDTLYDKIVSFTIQENTHIDTLLRCIGLKYVCNEDTLGMGNLSFANTDTTVVNATYLRTDTFPNIPVFEKEGKWIYGTELGDFYLLTSYQDKELLSAMELTNNGFFWHNVDASQYDTEFDKFMDLVKKYPDSHSLIVMLDSRINIFKSKNDVKKIFDSFSQNNKDSYYGKIIKKYLMDNFQNSILKTWDTGKSEAIIIDSTKYNLVIFSYAGCRPCIEEIPLLKQIYEDLSNQLDMTYVSLDNSKTVGDWQQLMRKEDIPWRCVLAEDDVVNIINKYRLNLFPYSLLVHPGGFFEPIDIRNKEDKDKLYSLFVGI